MSNEVYWYFVYILAFKWKLYWNNLKSSHISKLPVRCKVFYPLQSKCVYYYLMCFLIVLFIGKMSHFVQIYKQSIALFQCCVQFWLYINVFPTSSLEMIPVCTNDKIIQYTKLETLFGVFPLSPKFWISPGKQFWIRGNGVQVRNKGN